MKLDVTSEEDWARAVEAVGHFGRLDILVNDASILRWTLVEGGIGLTGVLVALGLCSFALHQIIQASVLGQVSEGAEVPR